jgi:hypothetical protein
MVTTMMVVSMIMLVSEHESKQVSVNVLLVCLFIHIKISYRKSNGFWFAHVCVCVGCVRINTLKSS